MKLLRESTRRHYTERAPGPGEVNAALGSIVGGKGTDTEVVIIREGPGNLTDRHWYTREAIMSGVKVFEGAKCFANHPDAIQQQVQPERNIRDQVGFFHDLRAVEANGRMELRGRLAFLESTPLEQSDLVKHTIALVRTAGKHAAKYGESVKPFVGISINADGEDAPAKIGGEDWNAVTMFTEATSADVVTFPAAGGKFLGLLESARSALSSGNHKEAGMKYGKMAAEIEALHAKAGASEDEAEKAKYYDEARIKAAAMRAVGEAEEGDAAEAKQSEEEARTKAAGEEANKAAEGADKPKPEPDLDHPGTGEESADVKVRELRESAKALTAAGKTDLATSLEKQAKALESRATSGTKLAETARKATIRADFLESVLRATGMVKESKLPSGFLTEKALWGKSADEQKSLVAERKAMFESLSAQFERTDVDGHGERTAPRSKDEDVSASLRESGVPIKSTK